jgi:hypothetical protein
MRLNSKHSRARITEALSAKDAIFRTAELILKHKTIACKERARPVYGSGKIPLHQEPQSGKPTPEHPAQEASILSRDISDKGKHRTSSGRRGRVVIGRNNVANEEA